MAWVCQQAATTIWIQVVMASPEKIDKLNNTFTDNTSLLSPSRRLPEFDLRFLCLSYCPFVLSFYLLPFLLHSSLASRPSLSLFSYLSIISLLMCYCHFHTFFPPHPSGIVISPSFSLSPSLYLGVTMFFYPSLFLLSSIPALLSFSRCDFSRIFSLHPPPSSSFFFLLTLFLHPLSCSVLFSSSNYH